LIIFRLANKDFESLKLLNIFGDVLLLRLIFTNFRIVHYFLNIIKLNLIGIEKEKENSWLRIIVSQLDLYYFNKLEIKFYLTYIIYLISHIFLFFFGYSDSESEELEEESLDDESEEDELSSYYYPYTLFSLIKCFSSLSYSFSFF
jgi:hypothetical protein